LRQVLVHYLAAPQIALENSPLADKLQALEVKPELKAYEVGLLLK